MMVDAWGIPNHILNDIDLLKSRMEKAVHKVGATLLNLNAVQFSPNGITVVAVLAESHASIHTYPEQGVLMADAFTCGSIDPEPLIEALLDGIEVSRRIVRRTARGDSHPTHVEEQLSSGIARVWELNEVIAAERTAYQDVLIARTAHGTTLFCNRERQSSELTQLIYHEGQFIPAALLAGQRKRVLVIGSSEGVVVQLALWCGAEHVVHVDIDRRCVDLCAEHLPYGYSKRDVQRYEKGTDTVQLLFEDGSAVVDRMKADSRRFDIIVMDLPDEGSIRLTSTIDCINENSSKICVICSNRTASSFHKQAAPALAEPDARQYVPALLRHILHSGLFRADGARLGLGSGLQCSGA